MTDYLFYWRKTTADQFGSARLIHAASDQFGRLSSGDRLWITTTLAGDLQLLGRIDVAKVTGQKEAAETLADGNLWEARYHVLADTETVMPAVRISIQDLAPELRFLGASDRLTLREGRVNAQELQTMRRLDSSSVELLAARLRTAGIDVERSRTEVLNTLSQLTIGATYSRKGLAARFAITDATINNGVFRPKGHNSIWLFITKNKTSDRTQYADHLDGDLLNFDGQTQGGTDRLLIGHAALGLDVLLFYRERKDALPGYSFRFEVASDISSTRENVRSTSRSAASLPRFSTKKRLWK
jgi:hypothetical protein